ARSAGWSWRCYAARRSANEVSAGALGMVVAMVVSGDRHYLDRETGERRRHHLHESVVQREFKNALRVGGVSKLATCHTLRTRLPLTCWRPGTTSVRFKSSLGIATWRRPWCIRTFSIAAAGLCGVRWMGSG